jgi:uncharacterized protein (DUF58 family)
MMPNRRNPLYLLIIALLIAGLLTGLALLFNIAYLLAGIWLLSLLWSLLSARGLGLRRMTRTRRAQVGHVFGETFMVRNAGIWPKIGIEIRDESNLPQHAKSHVASLGILGKDTWQVNTACTMRGEFRLGPITVISSDPFGLFRAERHIDATQRVLVYPAVRPIDKVRLPLGLLSGGQAQRYQTQNITTNAAGVRDYAPGDSINRVHWKSSARRDKLIVKEFELDPLVDIWLFLDLSAQSLQDAPSLQRRIDDTASDAALNGAGSYGPIIPTGQHIPPSTEEYGIVAAASLANHFIQTDRTLGFISYTPHSTVIQPDRGHRQLSRILEALAIARSTSQHGLREALALEAHRFMRGTTLIIVTASLDKNWVAEAQLLGHRGIRPLCIYIDPATFNKQISSKEMRSLLQISKIPTLIVRNGADIGHALAAYPV